MENKTIRVWDKEIDSCSMCQLGNYDDYGYFDCSEIEHDGETNIIHEDCPFSKPLSREDIESCGLKKTIKNQWIGWFDYYSGNVSGEYGYYLYYTIHFPRHYKQTNRVESNHFKIIMHRYFVSNEDETTSIEDKLKEGESEVVYIGSINNLPEFKLILKMLNIK